MQYLGLIKKDTSKLFNKEWLVDKPKVTYPRWLPKSESLFLVSHASGHLYLYNDRGPCAWGRPDEAGPGFPVYNCQAQGSPNPVTTDRAAFRPAARGSSCQPEGPPCVLHSPSLLLRELLKSYLGGPLCVFWSLDGRCGVTGGKNDLVTVVLPWGPSGGLQHGPRAQVKAWLTGLLHAGWAGDASAHGSGQGGGDGPPPLPLPLSLPLPRPPITHLAQLGRY